MSYLNRLLLGVLLTFGLIAGAQAQGKPVDYRLGAGDAIKISVFQSPDLTVETRVAESGSITYPLIGAVHLGGLSIAEAELAIANKLRDGGFVQKPQVNILLMQFKGNQVSILGMVNRPGRYPIETGNTRLTDMLATAGGAIPTGGADVIILSGVRDGKTFRREIDIPAMLLSGDTDLDVPVAGGDIIYVHRAPVFYIYGEVQRGGSYRLERNMTVLQGLAQSAGLTVRGTERGLRIHRRGPDGKVQIISPEKSDLIQADDVLYVQESFF
ncbi:MAG: polysaccharide export protein EpsE [Gammaproteobacteria bacterium]|nr:polysaccharide export protein EpsE [Gammaproteobacteria bacterium]MBU2435912.1 polysaccharide export protein EpsE [Gammaproteobacteria bacterium]MBU2449307.1 polysaccharide export protein EpsE [Gammaproteobacteria bacterium]